MTEQRARHDFAAIHRAFALPGELRTAEPYGSGHINDTFVAHTHDGFRYVLQRLNTAVFPDPVRLMENVRRVTEHLRARIVASPAPELRRAPPEIYPTRDGAACFVDAAGSPWRAVALLAGTRSVDVVESAAQASAAAAAFGAFQRLLVDLPGPRLHETLPRFHDSPSRLAALERAVGRDPHGRAAGAAREIAFARERESLTREIIVRLADGRLPERVTHNDTKINNVLFDVGTGDAVAVIDLDTVMPGAAVYDFGDLVRTMTCSAAEDERDLAKVELSVELFDAIARGYLGAARAFLAPAEVETLVVGGAVITFETGVRFLTDHLEGDGYFRIHRPGQNLDRARTQFRLVAEVERSRDTLERIVRRHAG